MFQTVPRIDRRGVLLVLSSPSGAGKTTLARRLLEVDGDIQIWCPSRRAHRGPASTRHGLILRRSGAFMRMRDAGELLEWAHVFDNLYGMPRRPVEQVLAGGRDVLFDIDWQGCQQLEEKLPHDLVRVFVLPPSGQALEQRLRARAVTRRMAEAAAEISHWAEYDYVLVNIPAEWEPSSLNCWDR